MLKNTGAMHVIWYLACNSAREKGTYTQNNFAKTVLLKLILYKHVSKNMCSH